MLSNFKIILVETSHPGNIGAVARAMKNMHVKHLRLVNPKLFPHADATSRASGADDILRNACIYDNIQSAIADCHIVLGASARDRTISWPYLTARECAEKWVQEIDHQPEPINNSEILNKNTVENIAIIFGRENSGLKNHELDLCHYLLRIPCNSEYSSLNIAAAVQVVCYELFIATKHKPTTQIGDQNSSPLATIEQMDAFYEHLQQTLVDIGFLVYPERTHSIMRRLRRIFNRIHLDTKELDILRGILRFAQNHNN